MQMKTTGEKLQALRTARRAIRAMDVARRASARYERTGRQGDRIAMEDRLDIVRRLAFVAEETLKGMGINLGRMKFYTLEDSPAFAGVFRDFRGKSPEEMRRKYQPLRRAPRRVTRRTLSLVKAS